MVRFHKNLKIISKTKAILQIRWVNETCRVIGCLLLIGLIGFLAYSWSIFWDRLEYGKCYCHFRGDRLREWIGTILPALKEELIYRTAPILIVTSILMLAKSPLERKINMVLGAIFILFVQLYFGLCHFHPEDGDTNYWFNIRIQGGLGVFCVCTYLFFFWLFMKRFYKKSKHPVLIFFLSHAVATLASAAVHIINNCLIIVAYTF